MKKLTALFVSLILVGGGCAANPPAKPVTDTAPSATTAPNTTPTEEFVLSAEITANPGEVKLQWSGPANMAAPAKYRLLNTPVPGRTKAENAYWQDLGAATREFVWSGVKPGKRYFRVCVVNTNTDVETDCTNEVELIISLN